MLVCGNKFVVWAGSTCVQCVQYRYSAHCLSSEVAAIVIGCGGCPSKTV